VSFPAFFDTCVLYGSVINDLLLRLADGGAFRPLWSQSVMRELALNLVDNGLSPEAADRRINAMNTSFPDAMVEGYEDLVDGMTCDPKDRHVLAAAVRANAELLVTFNVRDFPDSSTAAFDIVVVNPDDFLLDQLDLFPGLTIRCLRQLSEDYNAPPVSIDELLQWLTNAGVPKFTQEVSTRFIG
jgi:predicted nucleic acid-binding protein